MTFSDSFKEDMILLVGFCFFAKYAKMNEKIDDENHEFSKINQNSQKLLTCKQGKTSF